MANLIERALGGGNVPQFLDSSASWLTPEAITGLQALDASNLLNTVLLPTMGRGMTPIKQVGIGPNEKIVSLIDEWAVGEEEPTWKPYLVQTHQHENKNRLLYATAGFKISTSTQPIENARLYPVEQRLHDILTCGALDHGNFDSFLNLYGDHSIRNIAQDSLAAESLRRVSRAWREVNPTRQPWRDSSHDISYTRTNLGRFMVVPIRDIRENLAVVAVELAVKERDREIPLPILLNALSAMEEDVAHRAESDLSRRLIADPIPIFIKAGRAIMERESIYYPRSTQDLIQDLLRLFKESSSTNDLLSDRETVFLTEATLEAYIAETESIGPGTYQNLISYTRLAKKLAESYPDIKKAESVQESLVRARAKCAPGSARDTASTEFANLDLKG